MTDALIPTPVARPFSSDRSDRSEAIYVALPDGVPAFEAYYRSFTLWPATSLERRKAALG